MYVRALLRRRDDEDVGTGLFTLPERAPPKGPLSFRERGFSFIPLRSAHLEFLTCVYGREVPSIDEVVGRAMVDANHLPLGVVLVHFEPDVFEPEYDQRIGLGLRVLHAHFGKWLRVYPKDILRGMKEVADWLRQHNIFTLHAQADRDVEGSDTLLQWLGAEPTGHEGDTGPWFALNLRRCKI